MKRGHRAGAPRPLSDAELELIEALLGAAGMGAGRYLGQLPRVQVVGGCCCGCPSIDLAVGDKSREGSVAPVIVADAESPEGVSVGVILWARGGALSGLEVHPWNGSDTIRIPAVDSLLNFRK
ncbi:MAG: hypothetical protein QNL88_09665 [Acidobacteriota bacterium]|nr:hypothetical protein [Acidobacteriota bacterium]